MIKVITKDSIIPKNMSVISNNRKVSSPDPDCPYLIEKKFLIIHIPGSFLNIQNDQIMSIKVGEITYQSV